LGFKSQIKDLMAATQGKRQFQSRVIPKTGTGFQRLQCRRKTQPGEEQLTQRSNITWDTLAIMVLPRRALLKRA
jgi:hypothetical protein